MILAIETSCDETAVALVTHPVSGQLTVIADIISSQVALHAPFGGVVPELASREHLKNLPLLVHQAIATASVELQAIKAVAVTIGPGLNGCLLVGINFAKGIAAALNVPLVGINHLEGHLSSVFLIEETPPRPLLNLLVSGGHTELVLCPSFGHYSVIARTRDDAAGEAFDKSATLLGLPYPGGPALAALAAEAAPGKFTFPIGMLGDDTQFSFSGLKTAVRREVEQLGAKLQDAGTRASLAASTEAAIVSALLKKTGAAINKHRPAGLFLTGGVAANQALRTALSTLCERTGLWFRYPPPRWCTDNAAMIGAVAYHLLRELPQSKFSSPMLALDSRPRFPLAELRRPN